MIKKGFLTNLDVRWLRYQPNQGFFHAREWMVLSDLIYVTQNCYIVTVPIGFITDFATIPRPIRKILPPTGNYGAAAVLHDWLFANQLAYDEIHNKIVSIDMDFANRVFLEAMQELDVAKWKQKTLITSVDKFGKYWWKNREENKSWKKSKLTIANVVEPCHVQH